MTDPDRPTIGYVVGRYPTTSHTFILREIHELERLGWRIERFSVWRSRPEELLSADERAERERTYSVLPLTPRRVLDMARAHLRALRHPAAYARILREALALAGPGRRRRVLGLSWFAAAILIWHRARRAGISHLHVHLAGTATFDTMLASRFGRAVGEPLGWSMTVHGPYEFSRIDEQRLAEKVRDARFVVAISDFARSQLMAVSGASEWPKIRVVRCGVPTEHFAPRAPAAESERLRILCVGRLDPVKGQGVLLEALAIAIRRGLPVELELIGAGERAEELAELAETLGVEDHVEMPGAVGQDGIRDAYAAADVFCLPSFAEGIPIVLMEAMAMERAVLSTHVAGIPELVSSGVNGVLVRPGRADELADAFESLRDAGLRARLGAAGRETVRSEYELATNVRSLEAIFRSEL